MTNPKYIFVIIVALAAIALTVSIFGVDRSTAEGEARAWAKALGLQVIGISCAKMDTDGDGYVSCSVNTENGVQQIECAGKLSINSGCRAPKFRIFGE